MSVIALKYYSEGGRERERERERERKEQGRLNEQGREKERVFTVHKHNTTFR